MTDLSRRKLLGCVGFGSTVAVTGCLDDIFESEPDEARLHSLSARNIGYGDLEVDLAVENANGDVVFSETVNVGTGEIRGHPEVATEPDQYVARANLGDAQREVDIVEELDTAGHCVSIVFHCYREDDGDEGLMPVTWGPLDDC